MTHMRDGRQVQGVSAVMDKGPPPPFTQDDIFIAALPRLSIIGLQDPDGGGHRIDLIRCCIFIHDNQHDVSSICNGRENKKGTAIFHSLVK